MKILAINTTPDGIRAETLGRKLKNSITAETLKGVAPMFRFFACIFFRAGV